MMRFISVPRNWPHAITLAYRLVFTGHKALREGDHQIIVTKET